jgi:CRISPR-associated endonuclease/helicase Cas3
MRFSHAGYFTWEGIAIGLRYYLIDGADKLLLAHTARKAGDQPETLLDHSNLVLHYTEMLCKHNGLSEAIERAAGELTTDDEPICDQVKGIISRWFTQAIYLHDLGKINPIFQAKKMRNKLDIEQAVSGDSKHSLLSALLYLHIHLAELEGTTFSAHDKQNRSIHKFLKHVLYVFAYVISRHHTYLGDIEDKDGQETRFEKQLRQLQETIHKNKGFIHFYRNKDSFLSTDVVSQIMVDKKQRLIHKHSPFPFYVLTKLLYSTMVACDFYATFNFDTGTAPQFQYFGCEHALRPLIDAFHNTAIYRGVQAYRDDAQSDDIQPINKLRSTLFLETETQLLRNLRQHLYYLEAPTGSGKTNMSINLALHLLVSDLGLNKLIYVFPFNALIEQTKQTLDSIFSSDLQDRYRIAVVNSVTPIVTEQELEAERARVTGVGEKEPDIKCKEELLQRQMLQYPVTLTSHVNFFNYLFGIGRESNLAFAHLCNSVIILDEIQSYRNEIWKEIIHFLHHFAELLNMKIIIMSATLPKLDLLMEGEPSGTCSLVADRDAYFRHPLFRERVQPHYELLEHGKIEENALLEAVLQVWNERKNAGKPTRMLIEFITKKSARSFYQRLDEMDLNVPLFELSGDDSNVLRKRVLSQLGKDEEGQFRLKDAIVVATQVIEAGVDIDMDIGFKDISLLDSEEQFLGRINRSCLRSDCHAYFFDKDRTTMIYKQDWRTENDLRTEDHQVMLTEKDFSGFYELCMGRINEKRQMANRDNWMNFIDKVQQQQFKQVEETMQLITDKTYTLFISHMLVYSNEGVIKELDGEQVWKQFKELLEDREMDYAERRVKLSQIQEKMAHFTYSYVQKDRSGRLIKPGIFEDQIGTIFHVPDGERFMETDNITGMKKFNRQAYIDEERSLLL